MAVTFIHLLTVGLSPLGDTGTGSLSVWFTTTSLALHMDLGSETHSLKAVFVEGDKKRSREVSGTTRIKPKLKVQAMLP